MNESVQGIIDSHCHLDFKQFNKDREIVMENARKSGVVRMINSGVDYSTNQKSLELARKYDFIDATLGLSPNTIEGQNEPEIKQTIGADRGECRTGIRHRRGRTRLLPLQRCRLKRASGRGLQKGHRSGKIPELAAGHSFPGCGTACPGDGQAPGQGRVPLLQRNFGHHERGR